MIPEVFELLVASLAEGNTPTRLEAFLRLQMRDRRGGKPNLPGSSFPEPALDLSPEIRKRAEERAHREMERARTLGAFFLTPWDIDYPQRLRTITGPPPILYCRGDRACPRDRSVAIVGTQTPTRWGMDTAEKISGFLSGKGWTVVSGLAVGIDRHAHQAVVRSGGPTVAVLSGGLDRISPVSHQALAEGILATGGCLISELPFGTPPTAGSRVRRDRIQSGIALATILVESEIDGGAMHTARYTLDQGRHLVVLVPRDGSVFQSRGALKLLYGERRALPLEFPGDLEGFADGLERFLEQDLTVSRSP